jgi:motility quorum-sensing regulator/GCU-specific mRNA interferase toxin
MEKQKPHYPLKQIQMIVADADSQPFTVTALRGGLAMGLTEKEMRKIVLKLTLQDFYKSMTTHSDHQVWQDVYHGVTEELVKVYIKVTCYADDRPPVIQFKEK